jgi:restriction system protein
VTENPLDSGGPRRRQGRITNYAGQLWALRGRIEPGDVMVMPMKTTKQIALGRVTSGYEYRLHEEDPAKRHVVAVHLQPEQEQRRESARKPSPPRH